VSRICAGLDEEISAFRDRSLAASAFPYVFRWKFVGCSSPSLAVDCAHAN
jgi:hypothetical protein